MSDPFYRDQWLELWSGDCRDVLEHLYEKTIHSVITSPPYFGLRSYLSDSDPDKAKEIGREVSPDEYVQAMVEVMRGVRRVLRDDGTVWLNIGDSYAGPPKGSNNGWEKSGLTKPVDGRPRTAEISSANMVRESREFGPDIKMKDLIGIPWRVAFALQADGWYLRNAIVWETPNPMPESVTDRFTNSYEMVFLLSKKAKYFFDQDAVREPHSEVTLNRIEYGLKHRHPDGIGVAIPPVDTERMGERFAHAGGRNKRDVWTIPTHPYKGTHYAVFPKALVEPMIKASTSEKGCCPECGAPWRRVMEVVHDDDNMKQFAGYRPRWDTTYETEKSQAEESPHQRPVSKMYADTLSKRREHKGWQPSCTCGPEEGPYEPVPCIVLDPFAGSGTVGVVAQDLSRRALLIDLNAEYLKLQLARNSQVSLGLDINSTSVDGSGTLV